MSRNRLSWIPKRDEGKKYPRWSLMFCQILIKFHIWEIYKMILHQLEIRDWGKNTSKEILRLKKLSAEWSRDLNHSLFHKGVQLSEMISPFRERVTCTMIRWTHQPKAAKKRINRLLEFALQVVLAREKLPLWQHSQFIWSKLDIGFWMFLKQLRFLWKVVRWFRHPRWPSRTPSNSRSH